MALLQQLKNEWITKAAFAFTGGTLDRGGFTKNLVAAVRSMARHRLAEGTILLAGSQYVAAMVGLVTNIVSARLLGPKDFGLAALVLSYPLLPGSLMAVKSGWVTTRYIARFRAEGRAQSLGAICKLGYALDMTVSLIATLLVLVTAPWVAREFFHAPEITWLIIAYAACFPIWSLLGTSQALLTAFERFRWVGLLQVLDHVIGSLLVIALLLGGYGVAGVVLGSACGNVLIALIAAGAANAVLRREQLGSWWRCSVRQVGVSRKEITGLFGWN